MGRTINEIIVHCSATPEGKDFTKEQIEGWHKQRGFAKIGYHYVVYRDGTIVGGRKEEEIGAHCVGHNRNSIGICYIGGLTKDGKEAKDTRTEAQKKSLRQLLKILKAKYPKVKIFSHGNFAKKACPSFNATEEYKEL